MRGSLLFLVCVSFLSLARAEESKAARDESIPTISLPNYEVRDRGPADPPLLPKSEIVPADFSARTAPLFAQFPGHAVYEGVSQGTASVGVMVDREGKATDFLMLRYTKDYFGDSLMRGARRQLFTPRLVQGVAVPGRFNFTYMFRPATFYVQKSGLEAMEERHEEVSGGPKFIYQPHDEKEIDGGQLQPVRLPIPRIPAGYAVSPGSPLRVVVTFYVDEKGLSRLPNVESAPSAALISAAIAAVLQWEFKPPTIKRKGVLVYTARTLTFNNDRH
jgi:hypothetical protein